MSIGELVYHLAESSLLGHIDEISGLISFSRTGQKTMPYKMNGADVLKT
jgi:hypothetical protein